MAGSRNNNKKDDRNDRNDRGDKGDKGSFRMRKAKRKVCAFCVDKVTLIDYKDVPKIKKYVSERGKILPRRISGNCAKHQRTLTISIKRARHIALLPYTSD
jgi:small subunit ribosomal protein S18